MSQKRKPKGDRRRAIYIFPNLFTTMSLFFGFYSIMCSFQGRFYTSAGFILLAALMDGLDGTVARMTNTTSRFGVEYDSLSDLIAFGAAPSILTYLWALKPAQLRLYTIIRPDDYSLGFGLVAAFIYLACGALRLARFNVSSGQRDPGFFQGLPITGAAALVAACVFWHYRIPNRVDAPDGPMVLIYMLILSFLMISTLDFISFKHRIFVHNKHPFETLAIFVISLAIIITKAKTLLLPLGLIYLSLSVIITIVRRSRKKNLPPEASNSVNLSKPPPDKLKGGGDNNGSEGG
ncbi:MAG: CDP-diacylglycerol--serine O-phosphatidyltransferase [Deltaproteobacteria bacterium]|jgi:CDP-diacylglycerol--serine O-phosphatidyltransferase|nr:CDP-diacylglycerol--serine O-phosphatidyltransferase [Deltaproteobacteria bacterium]